MNAIRKKLVSIYTAFDEHKRHRTKMRKEYNVLLLITLLMYIVYEILQILVFGRLEFFRSFFSFLSPAVMLLNLLPLVCVAFILYCLFNSIKISVGITSGILMMLYMVNENKISFRDDPLRTSDLALFKEAANIMENYSVQITFSMIVGLLVLIAFLIFSFTSFKDKKSTRRFRIIGAAASALTLFVSVNMVYQNPAIAEHVANTKDDYYSVKIAKKKGLPLYLLSGTVSQTLPKPSDYSTELVQKELDRYAPVIAGTQEQVNIIAVMSEAYFDPSAAHSFRFHDGKYPMTNFDSMKKEGIHGYITVHGFGGGTATTECEFLTGINAYLADPSLPDIYTSYINKDIYGLPREFKDRGYAVNAIHPGHSWFYSRNNVYDDMGFDSFTTIDDLPPDAEQIHYYISDAVTTQLIIDDYEQHLQNNADQGYFNFTITIQNHGPYSTEPNDRGEYLIRPEGYSNELYNTVNNYMVGLSDSDRMLGTLREYLNTVDKPTVLVFFGDHLPFFDDEGRAYELLGYNINMDTQDGTINKYRTPYLIWGNQAFQASMQAQGKTVLTGERPMISANYLANEMFEYAGMEKPAFFRAQDELKAHLPVIGAFYSIADGNVVHSIPQEYQSAVAQYQRLQYHSLADYTNNTDQK